MVTNLEKVWDITSVIVIKNVCEAWRRHPALHTSSSFQKASPSFMDTYFNTSPPTWCEEWTGTMAPSAAMWCKFTGKIGFIVTCCWSVSKHTLWCEGRTTQLSSQLRPNCHTLYPGHPPAPWTKAIVLPESRERHRRPGRDTVRHGQGWDEPMGKMWQNWNYSKLHFCRLYSERGVWACVRGSNGKTAEPVRRTPLFSHTNCFIFPIKRPLCLSVSSEHGETVRRIDETQTDYLVWVAFPEQQRGRHNNR